MGDGADDPFDLELLLAAQRGETAAFAALYRRHSRTVLKYAWSRLGDASAAEEVLQEVFAIAWEKRQRATIVEESWLPWLLAIARNVVRNQLRKHPAPAPLPEQLPGGDVDPADLAWVRAELDKLTPLDRRLCELCLVQGYSYRQAAALVESSEAAVGKRLERARRRLRAALGPAE